MGTKTNKQKLMNWPWIVAGLFIIVTTFGGGGLWATYTSISGAIIAQGIIGVESKVKTVQHLDGGIVRKIDVRDGDKVEAGDLLLTLDGTSLRVNLNIVTNNLYELLARKAQLDAEQNELDVILFPEKLLENQTLPLVERIMGSKTALFRSRKKTRRGKKSMMGEKIVQLNNQTQGLNAQIDSKKTQAEILKDNIKLKEPAAKTGFISQDTMDQLNRQLVELTGNVAELHSNVARVGSTIAETELQILQIEVDFQEKVQEELREVTTQITELQEQQLALEERLSRTKITAPVTGYVLDMSIHTVGGVISPAKPILQIIPENARLVIETRIQTKDVDQVHIGQDTSVRLSAFDARTTPVLDAEVTKISAAQLVDSATNTPYFTVEVEIFGDQLLRLNKNQKLLPGMPVEVYIRTADRTPLDYLLKPLSVQIMRAFKEN